jgi:hypothetical protein
MIFVTARVTPCGRWLFLCASCCKVGSGAEPEIVPSGLFQLYTRSITIIFHLSANSATFSAFRLSRLSSHTIISSHILILATSPPFLAPVLLSNHCCHHFLTPNAQVALFEDRASASLPEPALSSHRHPAPVTVFPFILSSPVSLCLSPHHPSSPLVVSVSHLVGSQQLPPILPSIPCSS